MTSLAEQYRAERRQHSASMIYNPPSAPAQKIQIYDNTPPKTLADRAAVPRVSQYEQRASETDHGYLARLQPLLRHLAEMLAEDELGRVAECYNAAVRRTEGASHADWQAQRAARQAGERVDVLGTPAERASALGSRWGTRNLEGNGHLASQVLTTAGQPPLSMLSRLPAPEAPAIMMRTDTSALRPSGVL